jgi:hypothetical protein
MPLKRPSKDKVYLWTLLVVGACALAVYWLWGATTLGRITFSLLTVLTVILSRYLLSTNVLPKPNYLKGMGAKWNVKALVVGLLCFPGAILWSVCFAFAARAKMVPDTMPSVVLLLLLPLGLLVAIGAFFMLRGLWGKNS